MILDFEVGSEFTFPKTAKVKLEVNLSSKKRDTSELSDVNLKLKFFQKTIAIFFALREEIDYENNAAVTSAVTVANAVVNTVEYFR